MRQCARALALVHWQAALTRWGVCPGTAATIVTLGLLGLFFIVWCVHHGDHELETVCLSLLPHAILRTWGQLAMLRASQLRLVRPCASAWPRVPELNVEKRKQAAPPCFPET